MIPQKSLGRFIVHLNEPEQQGDTPWLFSFSAKDVILFLILMLLWYKDAAKELHNLLPLPYISAQLLNSAIALPVITIWWRGRQPRMKPQLAAVVDILPLGVQISTIASTSVVAGQDAPKTIGTPRFIPRENLIDVIVNEVVMGRSVESKVMFRVRRVAPHGDQKGGNHIESHFALMRDGKLELVDAFPLVKLSHVQCLELCDRINNALGKYI